MDIQNIYHGGWVFYLMIVWSLIWKGLALWRSAKKDQKYWFITMLILNTFGILEILYLFYFSTKGWENTMKKLGVGKKKRRGKNKKENEDDGEIF